MESFKFKDGIDLKKIGSWATLVSIVIIAYYSISTYKAYLEIKEIKKESDKD
jgi:hypothetical protein